MRRPSSPDPQVRYALSEANIAFVKREDRHRVDPMTVFLLLMSGLALFTYIVRA